MRLRASAAAVESMESARISGIRLPALIVSSVKTRRICSSDWVTPTVPKSFADFAKHPCAFGCPSRSGGHTTYGCPVRGQIPRLRASLVVRFEPQRVPTRLPCRKLIAARLARAAAVLSRKNIAAAGTNYTGHGRRACQRRCRWRGSVPQVPVSRLDQALHDGEHHCGRDTEEQRPVGGFQWSEQSP